MKIIDTIPYNQTKFKFISSHYNLHLQGLCIYKNEVCYFQTLEGDFNEEKDEWDESFCQIYKLSFKEKIKWLFRQKNSSGWLAIIGLILIEKQVKDHSITENRNGFTSFYSAYFINAGSTCS